jgi:hypothetical protein
MNTASSTSLWRTYRKQAFLSLDTVKQSLHKSIQDEQPTPPLQRKKEEKKKKRSKAARQDRNQLTHGNVALKPFMGRACMHIHKDSQ